MGSLCCTPTDLIVKPVIRPGEKNLNDIISKSLDSYHNHDSKQILSTSKEKLTNRQRSIRKLSSSSSSLLYLSIKESKMGAVPGMNRQRYAFFLSSLLLHYLFVHFLHFFS